MKWITSLLGLLLFFFLNLLYHKTSGFMFYRISESPKLLWITFSEKYRWTQKDIKEKPYCLCCANTRNFYFRWLECKENLQGDQISMIESLVHVTVSEIMPGPSEDFTEVSEQGEASKPACACLKEWDTRVYQRGSPCPTPHWLRDHPQGHPSLTVTSYTLHQHKDGITALHGS